MWEINKIIENDLLTHIISRPRILLGGDHPISKIDLNWWPAESGLIIKQLCLMCADVQRIKRRDVTELFSSCCRLVWFKLAHSLFYPKHNPSTFLNAHPSPLCVAERGLMLLTGSGEKQAAGPRFCNQSSSGVYALGCLAIYSGLSTQRERAALKNDKKCEKSPLSQAAAERHKGRISERVLLRLCSAWCFSHVQKMVMSLILSLLRSPRLLISAIMLTRCYIHLHTWVCTKLLLWFQKTRGEGKFLNVPAAAATSAVRLDGATPFESFLRTACFREHLGNRIALKLIPRASDEMLPKCSCSAFSYLTPHKLNTYF